MEYAALPFHTLPTAGIITAHISKQYVCFICESLSLCSWYKISFSLGHTKKPISVCKYHEGLPLQLYAYVHKGAQLRTACESFLCLHTHTHTHTHKKGLHIQSPKLTPYAYLMHRLVWPTNYTISCTVFVLFFNSRTTYSGHFKLVYTLTS